MFKLSQFINYFNIPVPISQELEDAIAGWAQTSFKEISKYCNRNFGVYNLSHDFSLAPSELSEYYSGYGTKNLILRNYPIIEVTKMSVLQGNEFIEIDTGEGTLYLTELGEIIFYNTILEKGRNNILVEYKTGFTLDNNTEDVDASLQTIALEKAGIRFYNSNYGPEMRLNLKKILLGANSSREMDLNTTINNHNLILDKYRRKII